MRAQPLHAQDCCHGGTHCAKRGRIRKSLGQVGPDRLAAASETRRGETAREKFTPKPQPVLIDPVPDAL